MNIRRKEGCQNEVILSECECILKEIRIGPEDRLKIYNKVKNGQSIRMKGPIGDIVFYAQDGKVVWEYPKTEAETEEDFVPWDEAVFAEYAENEKLEGDNDGT